MHKGVGDTALPKNAHLDSNQEATTASLQLIDGIHPRKPKQPAARKQALNMAGWPQWSPTQKAGTIRRRREKRCLWGDVSMESGLEGRNNGESADGVGGGTPVSMKSGPESRNNREGN